MSGKVAKRMKAETRTLEEKLKNKNNERWRTDERYED